MLTMVLLAWGTSAFALNPALDISQYAHTSWKIRDGLFKRDHRFSHFSQRPADERLLLAQ